MIAQKTNPRIVIVGTGSELALTAYLLITKLERAAPAIIAVDVGGGEGNTLVSTFSDMRLFNDANGITESDFLAGVGARFNYGFLLSGREPKEDFFLADSAYGLIIRNNYFHNLFYLHQKRHPEARLDDFSLAASLARAGRFAPKSAQANSIFSTLSYGYTFQAKAYENYFKRLALRRNVTYVVSPNLTVAEGEQGIERVVTQSGQILEADLFIDCSDARCLMSKLQSPFKIPSSYIPSWQTAVKQEESESAKNDLYAVVTATKTDIRKKISHGRLTSEETFRFVDQGASNGDVSTATAMESAWVKNCIALGAGFAKLPNLLPGNYHLILGQLLQLFDSWSGERPSAAVAEIFSESCQQSLEHVIDIINIQLAAHPLASSFTELTPANRSRVELFESSGALYAIDNAILPEQNWVALLTAMGYRQKGLSLQARTLKDSEVDKELGSMKALIDRATNATETYDQWLKKNEYASL